MDATSFIVEVLSGTPLIIITPYGTSPIEIINIISEAFRRAQIINVYIDREYNLGNIRFPIYERGSGIIIMTEAIDFIPYNTNITPIYIVEWGIRTINFNRFRDWIAPRDPTILYPTFIPSGMIPTIAPILVTLTDEQYEKAREGSEKLNIQYPKYVSSFPDTHVVHGGWITDDIIHNLPIYSPKIASLLQHLNKFPCVIICPYIHRYGLDFIHEIVKSLNIPIYKVYGPNDTPVIRFFNRSQTGILLTDDIKHIATLTSNIPIHIINLDSSQGMELMTYPHHHETINIYIAVGPHNDTTVDSAQYNLLISGINDSNIVFERLNTTARNLISDKYNNLYLS